LSFIPTSDYIYNLDINIQHGDFIEFMGLSGVDARSGLGLGVDAQSGSSGLGVDARSGVDAQLGQDARSNLGLGVDSRLGVDARSGRSGLDARSGLGLGVDAQSGVGLDVPSRSRSLGRVRSIFRDISTNEGLMSIGIELAISYSELPPNLQSKDRQLQSNTRHAIWLDERQVIEIKPFQVCGLANVRFAQEEDHGEDRGEDKIIYEIVYYHRGKKKAVIRNACNRHLLPAELH
jgi:hypothetical protein